MFDVSWVMSSYALRFIRFDEYSLTRSRDAGVNSRFSIPTATSWNPKRSPQVPALRELPEICAAISSAWDGSWEIRNWVESVFTASINDWRNSERICDRVCRSSNEYEVTFAGTKFLMNRSGSTILTEKEPN